MKRLLSIVLVIASMMLTTSAFADAGQARLEGKLESIGPRQQRVMVYRYVYDTEPFALTGETRQTAARKYQLVPQLHDIGSRTQVTSYKWVLVK